MLKKLNTILAGLFLVWTCAYLVVFVLIENPRWSPQPDIFEKKKKNNCKILNKMNTNLAGLLLVWSCT